MGIIEKFNLRWDGFEDNIKVTFKDMRKESEFFDVTLVAGDGKQVKANYKVILATGSSFFFNILRENPHPYPLIYLKGVSYDQLLHVKDFLYTGEARIAEEDLNQFMNIADDLKVKGLTQTGLQTKYPRSASPRMSHQEIAKEPATSANVSHHQSIRSTSIQCQEVTKEVATSPKVLHPPSEKVSDRNGTIPHATHEEYNENTSNVKVESCNAEHDNTSYRMNDQGKKNIRNVSMPDNNKENIDSKQNLKILGENFVKKTIRDFYAQTEKQKDGMVLSDKQEPNDDVVNTGKKQNDDVINTGKKQNDDVVNTGKKRNDDMINTGKKRKAELTDNSTEDDVVETGQKRNVKLIEKPVSYFDCQKSLILTKSHQDKVRFRAIVASMITKSASNDGGLECLVCGKQFFGISPKNNATSHVDHMHTNHLMHKCHVCGVIKNTSVALARHINLHKSDKILGIF